MRTWASPSSRGTESVGSTAGDVGDVVEGRSVSVPLAGATFRSGRRISLAGVGPSPGIGAVGGKGVPSRTGGNTSGACDRATRIGRAASSSSSAAQRVKVSILRFSSRASCEPLLGVEQPTRLARSEARRAKPDERRTRAIRVPRVRIDKRAAYSRKHGKRKREMAVNLAKGCKKANRPR